MDSSQPSIPPLKKAKYPLPYIIPMLQDWPITKLYQQRDAFMEEVYEATMRELLQGKKRESLSEQLAKTVYLERDRLVQTPWRVDPPDEMDFWSDIRQQLLQKSLDQNETQVEETNKELLGRIIRRYVEEITGNFSTTTYRFARKALPMGFNLLLNAATFLHKGSREKLQITGEVEHIRQLMASGGTIILVPTHFSNLDSILIGWTADRIGLTAFSYGAGLNLYNTKLLAFFFSRLGAYALDRRKKNNFYLQTLKSFSQASIEKGVHTLFFPGGTRSRSGQLESKLKMGLLGTVIDAQYQRLLTGNSNKIYVVPVVLNYHFVLEAKSLIDQYLQQTGKELYMVEKKAFGGAWNLIKFLWKFFSATSEIIVNFGKPLDVLGNFVDEQGHSMDQFGRNIALRDYFISEGELRADRQRNEEYTKMLAQRLVQRYHIENVVLSSHLVAFTAFEILLKQYPKLDLYGILRLPDDDRIILRSVFIHNINLLRKKLHDMAQKGQIHLSEIVRQGSVEDLIKDGVANVGTFHVKKALTIDKEGDISSEDLNLLYYYHNRLEGYQLEKLIEVSPK
jgi:glycerol-3-phosphate O-acyltransferase